MRRFLPSLILGLCSISATAFDLNSVHNSKPSFAGASSYAFRNDHLLKVRGLAASIMDESGPPVSAPGSQVSTPRDGGSSTRASSRATRRARTSPDRSTRSTDGRAGQQATSVLQAQAREQSKARARIPMEPLPPNIAAAVNRMPRPAGNGLSDMPHAPTAVAATARRMALLGRPVATTPSQTQRMLQRHQMLPSNVLDSLGGTSQSSPRTPALSIANTDTPDRSQPGTPVRDGNSQRSSFAFGEQPRSTTRRSGAELESMGSTPRMPPAPAAQSGSASASSVRPTPPDTVHSGPTRNHPSRPPNIATMSRESIHDGNASPNVDAVPTRNVPQNGYQQAILPGAGVDHAQLVSVENTRMFDRLNPLHQIDPESRCKVLGFGCGAVMAAGGIGMAAVSFPGHIAAGATVGAVGLAGMMGSQGALGLNSFLPDRARAQRQAGLDPIREAVPPYQASLRNVRQNIATRGRAVADRIRSMARVPADENVMNQLRRRSQNYELV